MQSKNRAFLLSKRMTASRCVFFCLLTPIRVNSVNSQDNALLVSGGADKNIKLWGLDFGDCRKSIFAHDDRYSDWLTHSSHFSLRRDRSDISLFKRFIKADLWY